MKDERVPGALGWALVSIAMGLSGCNGCSGCDGQTRDPASTVDPQEATTASAPSPASAQPTPPVQSANADSAVLVPPNPEHDPTGVRRCCKTISDNLETAPDKHKTTWKNALAACNEALEKHDGRKGLAAVREILTPVGWPAACH